MDGAPLGAQGALGTFWGRAESPGLALQPRHPHGFCGFLPRAATCPLSPAENLHPQHNQQEDQGRVSGIVSISLPSPAPFGVPNVPGEGATVPRGGL